MGTELEEAHDAAAERGYQVFHLNVLIETRQLAEVNKALRMAIHAAVNAALGVTTKDDK